MFLRLSPGSHRPSGFTIVELLIVIVVIAILAAIAIVSYTGIQDRARTTQMISGAESYIKALNLYAATNNSYPLPAGDGSVARIACFDGTVACNGSANATWSQELLAGVRTQMNGAPLSLPYQIMFVHAITYDPVPNANALHYYVLFQISSGQTCPSAVAGARFLNSSVGGSIRSCRMAMTGSV